ncbi:pregnancy-specific glycoprotein 22-like [Centroberyx affinis]|uniref:pregnancy-specific glycoprotein 22-like n=1 Tax=Centroberyx affinis TaxID=166261 RepID=UPI003A5BEAE5
MEAVIGLLMVLLGVSHGVETYCDGRQDGAQCFVALGGTVVLQLITQDEETYAYGWLKNNNFRVLYVKNNKVLVNELKNRSSFTPSNGTFRISNISWTDNAEYSLRIFDVYGREIATQKLQLSIQGVETYCDGRQDGAQCFGALGGTVVLQLITQDEETYAYGWLKNNNFRVLYVKNNTVLVNELKNRSSFTPSNGAFRINNINWTDNAEYSLQTFNQDGYQIATRKLQLSIQGVETYCDGRQDGAQCFGALGGTVVLQLITQDEETSTYRWMKNESFRVLYVKNNMVLVNNLKNRSSFTPSNGTFRLSNISWTDNAEYSLQTFNQDGYQIATRKLQLSIQGK